MVEAICSLLDQVRPQGAPHTRLITLVNDCPGHDRRYSIDPTRMQSELGWRPRHTSEQGLETTVRWFLDKLDWCQAVQQANTKLKVTSRRLHCGQEVSEIVSKTAKSTDSDLQFHEHRA